MYFIYLMHFIFHLFLYPLICIISFIIEFYICARITMYDNKLNSRGHKLFAEIQTFVKDNIIDLMISNLILTTFAYYHFIG